MAQTKIKSEQLEDSIVKTTDTQTLTNKTLTNPDITFSDNAPDSDVICTAYLSADQTGVSATTFTLVEFDSERFDVGGNFNTTTHQFTAPVSGYYQIDAGIAFTDTADAQYYGGAIYVSGSRINDTWSFWHTGFAAFVTGSISILWYVASGETIDVRAYTTDACSIKDDGSHLSVHLVSI